VRSVGIALEIPEWVPLLLEMLAGQPRRIVEPEWTRRLYSIQLDDRQLLIPRGRGYSPGLAKDLESMRLEEGLSDVVRLGTCGGYHPDHRIGDIVLCTDAIRGEGTSSCYMDDVRFPAAADFSLTRSTARLIEERGLRYRAGTLWTTDGRIAGQYDRRRIDELRSRGVLGVEMQSSTLFIVGKVLGIRTASFSLVVDRPSSDDPFAPTPLDPTLVRGSLELLLAAARAA
jgi:uridine phosphorylase